MHDKSKSREEPWLFPLIIFGSSGKCVPLGEERPKAFLMKVMKISNSKMQTDKSKCKNGGVSMMPKG